MNQRIFLNPLSPQSYRHTVMYKLFRHTIWYSLVKIHHLRHKWTINMYKSLQKRKKIKGRNLCLYQHAKCDYIRWYTNMYIVNRYTICETLVRICVIKHNCRSFLWYFFGHNGVHFSRRPHARVNGILSIFPRFCIRWWRMRHTEIRLRLSSDSYLYM